MEKAKKVYMNGNTELSLYKQDKFVSWGWKKCTVISSNLLTLILNFIDWLFQIE